ncbi:DUF4326 domain-containing protein [Ramlibacter sp. AN1133]|uniref:DUF4326 domain-containing protein n=1 Tax=Ramlibacter sp. AN1133 TaxID=3133429 RepID=UPI0030BF0D92
MPTRLQLRRTKGWRIPPGTVNCARPGRWGNPFPVEQYGLALSLALFENAVRGIWNPATLAGASDLQVVRAYEQHKSFLSRLGGHPEERAQAELRGRDLACWCSLEARCHVDIWMRLANG